MEQSQARVNQGIVAVLVIALAALGLGGCPALMVPSLAYQGLKSKDQGATTQNSSSRHRSSSPASDSSIE